MSCILLKFLKTNLANWKTKRLLSSVLLSENKALRSLGSR